MSTEVVRESVPAWLLDMDFCHIGMSDDGFRSYCGGSECEGQPPNCPGLYDGEAICNGCGRPTRPRCAQLSALDDLLYDDETA